MAKIITIVVTVIALALTFLLISSIDSSSNSTTPEEPIENTNTENKSNVQIYSSLPNEKLLTNDDFRTNNLIQSNDKRLVLSEPFIFRVEALAKTKINISNKVSSNPIVTNKILKAGDVEIFPVEEKISYDFWSAEHVRCSLNDIDLTEYFGSNNRAIRGWFTTSDQKLSYLLYRHQSI